MKKFFLTMFAFGFLSATGQQPYRAYMVSNAHFDSQWNWDVQTSIRDYVRHTLDRNLFLLEKFPNYVFNFEGGVKYQWMKEYYPEQYARIKPYITAGRWHIAGATWDANDPNMPSPESFFRNILLGQEFYQQEFGVKSTDIFLPDCFGFACTIPTIAKHCGLLGFSTQKLQWRSKPFYGDRKIPFNIGLWRGLDGAEIMACLNALDYGKAYANEDLSHNAELINLAKGTIDNIAYRYYGTGDIGGSPTVQSVMSIERGIAGDGPVKIISATSDAVFREFLPYSAHPELPVYEGELLMDVHATGCYTSKGIMKRLNRQNEQLAYGAEVAATIANHLFAAEYPAKTIDEAWKRFIWHQFHDDLTGTSIPRAYQFSWNDEYISQSIFKDIIATATTQIAARMNTAAGSGTPVVVFNPLAATNAGLASVEIPVAKSPKGVTVTDASGRRTNAQLTGYENGKATVLFAVNTAPASYEVYSVNFTAGGAKSNLRVAERSMENAHYILTLDENGDIASIIDKDNGGRQLVAEGKAFRLAMFTNNRSTAWPAWEIMKNVIDAEPTAITGASFSIEEAGPARATICISRTYGDTRIKQYISMTDGAADRRIDVRNEIDWASTGCLLKAEFPMSISNPQATYDLGLGSVRRGNNTPTQYEVYAHQWADITADTYGISILNDCKYGHDKPNDNTLRLTLIHTPETAGRYDYQNTQDFGHHTFTYAIFGHNSELSTAQIAAEADALNYQPIASITTRHNGTLGSRYSFVNVASPQIVVKAVKKAQASNDYIVRTYELDGKDTPQEGIAVEFPADIIAASATNGIEEDIDSPVKFSGRKLFVQTTAYSPRTYRVRLKPSGILASPKPPMVAVELPFTDNAFTFDAFNEMGNFDGHGNSYAAELITPTITSGGINFELGDPKTNNVVKCNGQSINLPEGTQRIYLLAANIDATREVNFTLDGTIAPATVPFYSGFYGQWGKTGFTEQYLETTPLAYVGTHRHNRRQGNEPYTFTYMFRIGIDVPAGSKTLMLPKDNKVAVFALTAVGK